MGSRITNRHGWRAALKDLLPATVLLAATAGVDTAAVHVQGSLSPVGPLADAALAMSAASGLAVLGLPGAVRRGVVRRAGIRQVDAMTGDEFEGLLAALYRSMGYTVRHTGRQGDFGADLVIEQGCERRVVQAKRYHGAVGIDAVQQAVGAVGYYDATGATVATNSRCTPAARALAVASGVDLVERDALVRLLAQHAGTSSKGAPARALAAQLAEGARVCAFVAATAARLAWWLVRVFARGVRAVCRAV